MKTHNSLLWSLAIVFSAAAQYSNQSNISETGTLAPVETTSVRVNNSHAAGDSGIVIGNESARESRPTPTHEKADLQSALKSGKGLVTAGIVLHFAGLALGSLGSVASSGSNDPGMTLTLSIGSTVMEIIGPILACSGGSRVQDAMERTGFQPGIYSSWHEYGAGWGFTGGGAALIVGGVMLSSTGDQGSSMLGLVVAIAGAALAITGEVQFIKATIHSAVYISKCREIVENHGLSFQLVPTIDVKKQSYGMALVGTF